MMTDILFSAVWIVLAAIVALPIQAVLVYLLFKCGRYGYLRADELFRRKYVSNNKESR